MSEPVTEQLRMSETAKEPVTDQPQMSEAVKQSVTEQLPARVLGFDYGSRTVGVAVSDPLGIIAQPVETIWRKEENKLRRTLARIEELIRMYGAEQLVLGLPKNMNNTLGERAEQTLEFKEKLEKRTGLPVCLWDERLTTAQAERILMEAGVRRENRKQHLDVMAAALILQSYLDAQHMKKRDTQPDDI